MSRFRKEAQALDSNEDFRNLFAAPESPVRTEMDRLAGVCQKPRTSDEERRAAAWKLEGMRLVERLVRQAAATEEADPAADGATAGPGPRRFRTTEFFRPRTGKYALPRGLAG
jgi:hypothetical protein